MSRGLLVLGAALALAACSHLRSIHWPWSHRAPPPPEAVHELVVTSPQGAPVDVPQYWKRNTLVVDLRGISGAGGVVLRPAAGTTWPVRLAVRVMPGSVAELEVRADQRLVLPITAQGTKPVDLELPPGVYTSSTEEIRVNWGPAASL